MKTLVAAIVLLVTLGLAGQSYAGTRVGLSFGIGIPPFVCSSASYCAPAPAFVYAAPVAYAPAPVVYQTAPAPVVYQAAPAPVVYAAPPTVYYAPAPVVYYRPACVGPFFYCRPGLNFSFRFR
jgi:nucleoid-associated protein YgaU